MKQTFYGAGEPVLPLSGGRLSRLPHRLDVSLRAVDVDRERVGKAPMFSVTGKHERERA